MFDYMGNLLCGKDMNRDSNVKMSCWKNYTTTAIADQTKTSEGSLPFGWIHEIYWF